MPGPRNRSRKMLWYERMSVYVRLSKCCSFSSCSCSSSFLSCSCSSFSSCSCWFCRAFALKLFQAYFFKFVCYMRIAEKEIANAVYLWLSVGGGVTRDTASSSCSSSCFLPVVLLLHLLCHVISKMHAIDVVVFVVNRVGPNFLPGTSCYYCIYSQQNCFSLC